MKVTIIFKSEKNHKGQTFEAAAWEVHSAYNFLELKQADGFTQQFNMDDIFSFSADGPTGNPA